MSWSVSLCGTKKAVLNKLEEEFNKYPLADAGEQAIKLLVRDTARLAVADFGDDTALELTASGSMSNYDAAKKTQAVSLNIKPLYGFLPE